MPLTSWISYRGAGTKRLKITEFKSNWIFSITLTATVGICICTYVLVNQYASSCSYGKSEHGTKHPEHTHEDDDRVLYGPEEDHIVEVQDDVKELAAEGAGVVKHQEVIGTVNVHRNFLMTLSESFDI